MLNAVVAAYYYLRVLVIAVVGVLFLGVSPGGLLDLANDLGRSLTFAY
jgi:hypothetical protein